MITVQEALNRAQRWVDIGVPYSQDQDDAYSDGEGARYRPDCSGYVAMAWRLPKKRDGWDFNTDDFDVYPEKTNLRSLHDLASGDAVLKMSGVNHIVLFKEWIDPNRHGSGAWVYSQPTFGQTARLTTYTLSGMQNQGYRGIRYNHMVPLGGAAGGYRDGTVLREPSGAIGVMAGGALVPFVTVAEIAEAGYADAAYITVPAGYLASVPAEPVNGTIIRRPNGWLAVIANGARFGFATMDEVSEAGYGARPITTVPSRAFDALPTVPRNGALVRRPNGWIAVMAGGARLGFATVEEVAEAGHEVGQFTTVPTGAFDALPTVPRNGTRIRRPNGWIAVVAGGARFGYQTIARVENEKADKGYDGQPFTTIGTTAFDALPTVARDGTLVRGPADSTVWRIDDGTRTMIVPNSDERPTLVPRSALDAIPVA